MKKSHATIGLMAAFAILVGLLLTLVGLPSGRASDTAFAFHIPPPPTSTPVGRHISIDCDPVTPGIQSTCNVINTPGQIVVDVVLVDHVSSGDVTSLGIAVRNEGPHFHAPPVLDDGSLRNINPDFNEAGPGAAGLWFCDLAPGTNDNGSEPAPVQNSELGCFSANGISGASYVAGAEVVLGHITYDKIGGSLGASSIGLTNAFASDNDGLTIVSCYGIDGEHGGGDDESCFPATINMIDPPIATPTATPAPDAHLAIDCDVTVPGVQDDCTFANTPGQIVVALVFSDNAAVGDIGTIDLTVRNAGTHLVAPFIAPGATLYDVNPDFNQAGLPEWNCGLVPTHDDGSEPAPIQNSRIRCFTTALGNPNTVAGADTVIAHVIYDKIAGSTGSTVLSHAASLVADSMGFDRVRCYGFDLLPGGGDDGHCFSATVNLVDPPTPAGPAVIKIPEGNANNVDLAIPGANLWICITGPCSGPGEGNLIVFEYATNVTTGDFNGDSVLDGLGAYEFLVEYDNFVIASVNPSDVVFNPGPITPYPNGADATVDGEGAARAPATCTIAVVTENFVRFGCVTSGPTPGPLGDMDIARLNLIPHEDLKNDLIPGNDNGVVTVIKDNGCELVDVFGHPVVGSIAGGLTPVCGNLAITVRMLEGDLNLDCAVDVQDQQLIAFRYASEFGSGLYDRFFDLEPALQDLDIDIKDVQKVFGRDASTCQTPIQPQPPVLPGVPFAD